MKELSIEPTDNSLHLLMIARANADDLDGVQEVLSEYFQKGYAPSTSVMNTVLKSVINSPAIDDWSEFMKTYSSIFQANGVGPDGSTYTLLLKACLKDSRADDAVMIIDEMLNRGILLTEATKEAFRNVVGPEIYDRESTRFPKVYIPTEKTRLKIFDTVDKSLNFRKVFGVEPRVESSMALLRRNPKRQKVLDAMRDNGEYSELIRYYAREGDVASVRNIMDDMRSANYPCDVEMLNTLTTAYSRRGDYKGAQDTVNQYGKYHVRRNISTMRLLIGAYANGGNPEGAEEVLRIATNMGYHPGKGYTGKFFE